MTLQEMDQWDASFRAFHARFAHLFARQESREQSAKYLRGLLAPVERKNGWQMAQAVGDPRPDAMERLLYQVDWDAEAARDILEQFVTQTFGDPEAIGVVDETGFLKKGDQSAGVARQYTGTAGKVDNAQVGTFLSYASPKGHVFLDRRLFLSQAWANDQARRQAAKVPDEVVFETKPQQALAMLQHAWALGVPMRWVTGDEVYGDSCDFRAGVQASGHGYVLAVASTTPVWTRRPPLAEPALKTGGRPRTKARLAAGAPPWKTVAEVVARWPASRWERFAVAEGEKGPRDYDWARSRVIERRDKLPGPEVWLLARRSVSESEEIAYYLCLAPRQESLRRLAEVAATRYTIEQCFEEGKGETGLDQYEVRFYGSWYRHITLSMMALAWLASLRNWPEEKKRGGRGRVNGARGPTPAGDRLAAAGRLARV
jgi:SRSO17 transposase